MTCVIRQSASVDDDRRCFVQMAPQDPCNGGHGSEVAPPRTPRTPPFAPPHSPPLPSPPSARTCQRQPVDVSRIGSTLFLRELNSGYSGFLLLPNGLHERTLAGGAQMKPTDRQIVYSLFLTVDANVSRKKERGTETAYKQRKSDTCRGNQTEKGRHTQRKPNGERETHTQRESNRERETHTQREPISRRKSRPWTPENTLISVRISAKDDARTHTRHQSTHALAYTCNCTICQYCQQHTLS